MLCSLLCCNCVVSVDRSYYFQDGRGVFVPFSSFCGGWTGRGGLIQVGGQPCDSRFRQQRLLKISFVVVLCEGSKQLSFHQELMT